MSDVMVEYHVTFRESWPETTSLREVLDQMREAMPEVENFRFIITPDTIDEDHDAGESVDLPVSG